MLTNVVDPSVSLSDCILYFGGYIHAKQAQSNSILQDRVQENLFLEIVFMTGNSQFEGFSQFLKRLCGWPTD